MTDKQRFDLEQRAQEIQNAYTILRRRKYPSYRPDAKRWTETLIRHLGEFSLGHGIPPEKLVQLAFEAFDPQVPQPNQLTCQRVQERWDGYRKGDYVRELRARMDTQLQLFTQYVNAGYSPEKVLDDPDLYFNPVFRYLAAATLKRQDLVARYLPAAHENVRQVPEYMELLTGRFPEEVLCHLR